MDALAVTEKTGLPFASCHPGQMHACGHDGHMAMLLELARRLDQKKSLNKNVLLLFQPGEESPGGAEDLCNTGVLEEYGVEAIFGMHLWPEIPAGKVASRPGELMSRVSEVSVDVFGRSAHVGKAEKALDAMAAGVAFYSKAVAMEQAMDPGIFRLLKFGKLESGTTHNVIFNHTWLYGSLRAFSDEVFDTMRENLYRIAEEVESQTGCSVNIRMSNGYPAVYNSPEVYEKVESFTQVQKLAKPSMISEDFSFYQRRVPGVFFFLGTGDSPALHADNFQFDENILLEGAAFFEQIAEQYE